MRFYEVCVEIARSIGALCNEEQMTLFIKTEYQQLWEYQVSFGMWIRNHLLPHNAYLCQALAVLGYTSFEEMSLFLIEFAQQYWKLEREKMME